MANKAVRDVVQRYDEYINPDDQLPDSVWVGRWNDLISKLDPVYNWGRKSSIWPLGFGLACCAIEMICTGFARFDISRFGAELFRASPRQADVMIVSGTVTKKMLPKIVRLYNQMPEPKYVISMGACATGGGPFKEGYNVVSGVDKYLPVDVYIPGCPPTPQALLQGLMTLQAKIEGQKLSEVPWYQDGVSEAYPVPVLGPDLFDPRQIPVIDARLAEQQEPETKMGKAGKAKPAKLPEAEVQLANHIAEQLRASVGDNALKVEGNALIVEPLSLIEVCRTLNDELGFDLLANLTSVDYPDRFEVIYHIYNTATSNPHVYLKVHVDKEYPVVPSVMGIYRAADFQEREVYDMMGIRFAGHPNLKRILLWEGFEGYPLRKDWKEAYYEEEQKPFESRWPEGYHVAAEDNNIWGKNSHYPQGWDPKNWKSASEDGFVLQPNEIDILTDVKSDQIILNLGPQHPSTHGVFQMRVLLDGETIVDLEPVMGYLHRNHEKIGERNAWLMNMPFTDRLDYITGMCNNFGYAITVEKLMGIEVPERAEYIRVIMAELTRIASHLWAAGFLISDLGAFFTPAHYIGEEREIILDLFEMTAGARMMVNYFRFGGVAHDISDQFIKTVTHLVTTRLPRAFQELDYYLTENEIVQTRTKGIGVIPRDLAVNYGLTGPMLRASGVKYDVRKADPYSIYDRFDFDVPTRTGGDIFDRYMVRSLEAEESRKIIEQALRDLPGGPILTGTPRWSTRVPAGEAYGRVENPKGELGFYVVSEGGSNPYRYHIRSPSFVNLGILAEMCKGHKVADVIGILGSLDIVLGEVDR